MKCPKCGFAVSRFDEKCPRCGESLAGVAPAPAPQRPPTTAAPSPPPKAARPAPAPETAARRPAAKKAASGPFWQRYAPLVVAGVIVVALVVAYEVYARLKPQAGPGGPPQMKEAQLKEKVEAGDTTYVVNKAQVLSGAGQATPRAGKKMVVVELTATVKKGDRKGPMARGPSGMSKTGGMVYSLYTSGGKGMSYPPSAELTSALIGTGVATGEAGTSVTAGSGETKNLFLAFEVPQDAADLVLQLIDQSGVPTQGGVVRVKLGV